MQQIWLDAGVRLRGMTWVIRPATLEDAAAIAYVQVESWRSTYRGIVPEAFLAELNEARLTQRWQTLWPDVDGHIFVAAEGDDRESIFGFACGGALRLPVESYDGELYAIYLVEAGQRRGVGRSLLDALVASLVAAGCKSLLVWVLEANPAVAFYERMGGVRVARKTIDIGGVDLPEVALGWAVMPSVPNG
jgi:ribosomal protein S18 acetylase RimI-like enzyme